MTTPIVSLTSSPTQTDRGLSDGVIAGIVVGSFIGALLIALLAMVNNELIV